MPITKYENRQFEAQTFLLEECWFVNCVLRNCRIFYRGSGFIFENTRFENCQWTFQDHAGQTIQLLTLIGLIQPNQAPPPQIQASGGLPN